MALRFGNMDWLSGKSRQNTAVVGAVRLCGVQRLARPYLPTLPRHVRSACFCRDFLSRLSEHDCRLLRAAFSHTRWGRETLARRGTPVVPQGITHAAFAWFDI